MKKLIKNEGWENQFDLALPGTVSTDIFLLDMVLGNGIPMGRSVSIEGKPGIGKTSFAMLVATKYLKHNKGKCFYFEKEAKPPLAEYLVKTLGLDLTRIVKRRPDNISKLLTELEDLAHEIDEGCIIVDSLSSFGVDRGEYGNKDYVTIEDDPRIAGVAQKYTTFMQGPFPGLISNKKIVYLIINQIRDNLGSKYAGTHTPGGWAPKFLSSLDISVSREDGWKIMDPDKNIIGQNVTFKTTKSIVGKPFKSVTIPYYWESGYDGEEALLMAAYERGIVKQTSGWFELGDRKLRKHEYVNLLRSDKEIYGQILEKLLPLLG